MGINFQNSVTPGYAAKAGFEAGKRKREVYDDQKQAQEKRDGFNRTLQQQKMDESIRQFDTGLKFRGTQNELNRGYQTQARAEAEDGRLEFMQEQYKMKTDAEKQYITDRSNKYRSQMKAIDDFVATGKYTKEKAQSAYDYVNNRFKNDDINVTDKRFPEVQKADKRAPMYQMPGGKASHPAVLNPDGSVNENQSYQQGLENQAKQQDYDLRMRKMAIDEKKEIREDNMEIVEGKSVLNRDGYEADIKKWQQKHDGQAEEREGHDPEHPESALTEDQKEVARQNQSDYSLGVTKQVKNEALFKSISEISPEAGKAIAENYKIWKDDDNNSAIARTNAFTEIKLTLMDFKMPDIDRLSLAEKLGIELRAITRGAGFKSKNAATAKKKRY